MAKFSDVEMQMMSSIRKDRLRSSLAAIREATEDLWAPDAPRIIQDYTDHGVAHFERVASYAEQILAANGGRPLSGEEMYLLLAGVYLHDIGMQCDVIRWPEIKTRAESLGGKFEVEFINSRGANHYSLEEQASIRKNHQYISAAWIDYGFTSGKTPVGPALKTVPNELVDDLMDVCKYHSKLPITNCAPTFRLNPSGRKQLVSAVLRFADEMDIDSRRVSVATVEAFSIDPKNALYWWLHNQTIVAFPSVNVVSLTVRLHPNDFDEFRSLVNDVFINEFLSKNRAVTTVLAQHGIPLVLSDDSKVIADNRAEPLPKEIRRVLSLIGQRSDPVIELANEVQTWLRAIQYEVSDPRSLNGRIVEMVATLDQGAVRQRVLVRCIGGEIFAEDVASARSVLDRKRPESWIISDRRVSEGARKAVGEDEGVRVFNLTEFLTQLVWGSYFESLIAAVEKEQIPELYVDLGCHRYEPNAQDDTGRESFASLDQYVDEWLMERGKVHVSLLGDFGSGKTWFCRHYAYRQLHRYLQDPVNQRMPLLLTLRSFVKTMKAEQLINEAFLEQYKLPFVGSGFEVFKELNRRGKLLLILDGFDEMARQVDYQTVVDNFWELARLVEENSKVILTSRTEYFRWAKESEKILGGEEFGRGTILLSPPKFEVIYLEPFSPQQVREVIVLRLGKVEGNEIADRILGSRTLAEMASKPVLVELLLAALTEVSATVLENPALVYLYATNKLLLRNITAKKTFTSTGDKLFFLCELAWEMIGSGDLRIHYTEIPDRIKAYFGDRIEDTHQLDTWDYDLRSQTLLHRNVAGYYEFAHKSLAEYFVAYKFGSALGCLRAEFLNAYLDLDGRPSPNPFSPCSCAELAGDFGSKDMGSFDMRAVRDLLREMIDSLRVDRLWQLLLETRGRRRSLGYVGGNIVTLLSSLGATFARRDLSLLELRGATFDNSDLRDVSLGGAVLQGARFIACQMEGADLSGADLSGVSVDEQAGVTALCWSVTGDMIACSSQDQQLRIWDLVSASIIRSVRLDTGHPWSLDWAANSGLIAAAGNWGKAVIWETPELVERHILAAQTEWFNYLRFHPSVPEVVTSHGPEGVIRIWDLLAGHSSRSKRVDGVWSNLLSFDPTGNRLLTGGRSGRLTIRAYPSLRAIRSLSFDIAFTEGFFSADGSALWLMGNPGAEGPEREKDTARQQETTIAYLPLDTGKVETLLTVEDDSTVRYALNPRHRVLARLMLNEIEGSRVELWRLKPQAELIRTLYFTSEDLITGGSYSIGAMEFSPDGSFLAVSRPGGAILILNAADPDDHAFGTEVTVLISRMRCSGLRLAGAKGLVSSADSDRQRSSGRSVISLLEYFAAQGAILDPEQKALYQKLHGNRTMRPNVPGAPVPKKQSRARSRKKGD